MFDSFGLLGLNIVYLFGGFGCFGFVWFWLLVCLCLCCSVDLFAVLYCFGLSVLCWIVYWFVFVLGAFGEFDCVGWV